MDGSFQAGPHFGKVFGGEALVVAEAAEQRFVWAHLIGSLQPHSFAHAARQDSVHVGDRRNDAGNEVVLEFENHFGTKRTLIGFSPQLRACGGIDELHR